MVSIVKGFERSGNREFLNFLVIAKGSDREVRPQLYRAFDGKYITAEKLEDLKTKQNT